MSRLVSLHVDRRLQRAARLGVAAAAGFAFAVAFAAGSRSPHASQPVLPHAPVAERTNKPAPATAPRFEPVRALPDLAIVRRVVRRRVRATTAPAPVATVATTPATTTTTTTT